MNKERILDNEKRIRAVFDQGLKENEFISNGEFHGINCIDCKEAREYEIFKIGFEKGYEVGIAKGWAIEQDYDLYCKENRNENRQ